MTKYNHRDSVSLGSTLREVVFGVEDGMVSTLGAITGIAIGTHDPFVVILSGLVIISVESISMGIGSYLSNHSEHEVNQRRILEEKEEIEEFPENEKRELFCMFIEDGWPMDLAKEMSDVASRDKKLMLREMMYRELSIAFRTSNRAVKNGFFMFVSYIVGGLIPLFSYFILPIQTAFPFSIAITLAGLFGVGVIATRFTKTSWITSGGRILALGVVALVVGFFMGRFVSLL